MKHKYYCLVFVLPMLLAACGHTYDPKKLANASRNECIYVDQRITYAPTEKNKMGILPGVYKADKEDSTGTFFRGPNRPIWFWTSNVPNSYLLKEGGIWIPLDPKKKLQLYQYFETSSQTSNDIDAVVAQQNIDSINKGYGVGPSAVGSAVGGFLVNAIIQSGVGDINMIPEIADEGFNRSIPKPEACREAQSGSK